MAHRAKRGTHISLCYSLLGLNKLTMVAERFNLNQHKTREIRAFKAKGEVTRDKGVKGIKSIQCLVP